MIFIQRRTYNKCPVCSSPVIPNQDKTLKFCSNFCYEEFKEVLDEISLEYARDDETAYELNHIEEE